ncbi:MAG: hypothetical protein KC493_11340 [Bacteriovoracaceae bacterium]|nr:hypothetical protein [Bacteriovoracaceae bacterium]
MNIACLGWGSLVWDPRELPFRGKWHIDGPSLPIEFARESMDGRITLVITEHSVTSNSLWSIMNVSSINDAKIALADREGISPKFINNSIGYWDKNSNSCHGLSSEEIKKWAENKNLDGVVWTNLKYGFRSSRGRMPEYIDVLEHLKALSGKSYSVAEEYVRNTPSQVKTEFRAKLEKDLGWRTIE